MRIIKFVFLLALLASRPLPGQVARPPVKTFCNPLNLNYAQGMAKGRHAADPVIVPFKGRYYLFTTWDLPGYRVSEDLVHWDTVLFDPEVLPLATSDDDRYCAPAAATDGQFVYFITMIPRKKANTVAVLRTREPQTGKWEACGRIRRTQDPCLFIDEDRRFYLYYGLGQPTRGFEIDAKTFSEIPGTDRLLREKVKDVSELTGGFERGRREIYEALDTGAYLDKFKILPCQEGAWMTRHNGRYYLQYATPGTACQWYCDAVMEGNGPLGPFKPVDYGPASMKVGGFIGSAGHSCVFQDFHGNWWRVTTMWVGVDWDFERRIGLFPVGFDQEGRMFTSTDLGDLPQVLPTELRDANTSPLAGWWVQSYHKTVTASSTLEGHEPELAADENVRTWWSARTGNPGEWFRMDLGKAVRVNAVQVNFAEQDCGKSPGDLAADFHHYRLSASENGESWQTLAERNGQPIATPHDYIALEHPVQCRYIKVENIHMAKNGKFALRDLRIFGQGGGQAPPRPPGARMERHKDDDRNVSFSWMPVKEADGYLVRYGTAPGALYQCLQVQGGDQARLTVHTLNHGVKYYFRVDAFNGSGLALGECRE